MPSKPETVPLTWWLSSKTAIVNMGNYNENLFSSHFSIEHLISPHKAVISPWPTSWPRFVCMSPIFTASTLAFLTVGTVIYHCGDKPPMQELTRTRTAPWSYYLLLLGSMTYALGFSYNYSKIGNRTEGISKVPLFMSGAWLLSESVLYHMCILTRQMKRPHNPGLGSDRSIWNN